MRKFELKFVEKKATKRVIKVASIQKPIQIERKTMINSGSFNSTLI